MVWIKRINRQRESKIPNTSGGRLLRRTSASYKMLLSRVTFGIQTLAKSWTARRASHQPAFMDSWVSYGVLSSINGDRYTVWKYVELLKMIELMVVMLMVLFRLKWVGAAVSSMWNWSYSKGCVWNLWTKLCRTVPGKWNFIQITHG